MSLHRADYSYEVIPGVLEDEGVELFRKFYSGENQRGQLQTTSYDSKTSSYICNSPRRKKETATGKIVNKRTRVALYADHRLYARVLLLGDILNSM